MVIIMKDGVYSRDEILAMISDAVKLTEEGKYESAFEIYNKLLPYNLPEVYNNLGNLYRRQGMVGRAIEMYKQAIQNAPDFALAYFNLACALMEIDRFNEATMFFEKAENLGLKNFDLDVQLALCYIATGNKRKAKEKLKDKQVRSEVETYIEGGLDLE